MAGYKPQPKAKKRVCLECEQERYLGEFDLNGEQGGKNRHANVCKYCRQRNGTELEHHGPRGPAPAPPQEIRNLTPDEQRQLEALLTDTTRIQALEAAQVSLKAIKAAEWQLYNGTAKDPAAVARNLATVAGISTDKFLALTGRPSQIVEHRDSRDLVKSLAAMAPNVFAIDGTAEEIDQVADEKRIAASS
jgi:hypothetical protein